jgi:hypothetical protein
MSMARLLFDELISYDLGINTDYFTRHEDVIREKLLTAAPWMTRPNGGFFAINQCMHLASSLVLEFSSNLNRAIDHVRQFPHFVGLDPTIVVTVAMLYYLLRTGSTREDADSEADPLAHAAKRKEAKAKEAIRKQFDLSNWFIGVDGMRVLGIEPLCSPALDTPR